MSRAETAGRTALDAADPRAPSASAAAPTRRQAEKAQRRLDLLAAAGRLFGRYGYSAVALDEIGSEVGVSGQAIYRHFAGKQDLLGQLLIGVSERLLEAGRAIRSEEGDPSVRLDRLIAHQVGFAMGSPDIIRIQDQELLRLTDGDRRRVRRMQREYVDIWSAALQQLHPWAGVLELRTRVHAVFGLINSTEHSMRHLREAGPDETADSARLLAAMARAAIRVEHSPVEHSPVAHSPDDHTSPTGEG